MLTYYVYAPLLNQIDALSLDVIWNFETTSNEFSGRPGFLVRQMRTRQLCYARSARTSPKFKNIPLGEGDLRQKNLPVPLLVKGERTSFDIALNNQSRQRYLSVHIFHLQIPPFVKSPSGFQWVNDSVTRNFFHSTLVIDTKETDSEGLQTRNF
jgi:hypothetical protein